MKKLVYILILFLIFCLPVFSQPIDLLKAEEVVNSRIKDAGLDEQFNILSHDLCLDSTGSGLVFLFHLSPRGYMFVSGKIELPPVIAYSFTNDSDPEGRLVSLVKADLMLRLKFQPEVLKTRNREMWDEIGEDQALEAYLKFNFDEVDLLVDSDTSLYSRIAQNIKDTLPVHLAVVDPAWSMGHNVVVDGYNTNEYFHLNFGWGGPSNGWYLLPEEIPYGLTVIEGAIVDIISDFPTTIAEHHTQSVLFYPNPASYRLQVSAGNEGYNQAELFSPDGCLLKTINLGQSITSLDLTNFQDGIYLIRLLGPDGVTPGKLLIRK